ncbi:MAG: hypothetical protein V8Q93_12210 [Blautia faecis]
MTMLSGSFVVSAPAEVKAADKKLVFWDKSEYVAAYNDMMKAKWMNSPKQMVWM